MTKQIKIVVAAVVLVAAGFFLFRGLGVGGAQSGNAPTRAFFSADDGRTYFTGDVRDVPPFTRDGKVVVRAYVVSVRGAKKVLYLERFKPDARDAVEKARADPEWGAKNADRVREAYALGMEQKKPGASDWFPVTDTAKRQAIVEAECPPGSGAELVDP